MFCCINGLFYTGRPDYREPANTNSTANPNNPDALQTLKLRLAKGEITVEEYSEMIQILSGNEALIAKKDHHLLEASDAEQPRKAAERTLIGESKKPRVSLRKSLV